MSAEAEALLRAQRAVEIRTAERLADLRVRLEHARAVGATLLIDLGSQVPAVLARVVRISGDTITVIDFGDACVLPKPERTIAIGQIVKAEPA